MNIIEITVKYAVKTKEDASRLLSILAINGSEHDRKKDEGVRKAAKEDKPYVPSNERTRLAYEAIGRCGRVSILSPLVLEKWSAAYPHIDLAGEIAKCEAWAESKAVKRTPRGWQKTLNSWLSREQDKRRGVPLSQSHPEIASKLNPVAAESETAAWIEAGK